MAEPIMTNENVITTTEFRQQLNKDYVTKGFNSVKTGAGEYKYDWGNNTVGTRYEETWQTTKPSTSRYIIKSA